MKPVFKALRSRPAASRGLTLIELMIAVTIGLLLTVVIAQLFLGSRQTYATTDDVSRMQENIRFTQDLLIRTVHLAGYKSQPTNRVFTTGGFPGVFDPPNLPVDAADGAGTASDTLIVRYQGSGDGAGNADGTVVDCLGNRYDFNVMATNIFTIAPNPVTGRNGLFCNGVEVVPNVVNMQLLFGEDTNVPNDFNANRYVARGSVADMRNIVTVRVALLFETPTSTSRSAPDTVAYDMFSDGTVVMPAFNDRRIRRLVTTTINLRNRTP